MFGEGLDVAQTLNAVCLCQIWTGHEKRLLFCQNGASDGIRRPLLESSIKIREVCPMVEATNLRFSTIL